MAKASKRKARRKPAFTGKQQAFINAYFICHFNGVRAARMAGYEGTYGALRVQAHENLTNPNIREAIDKRMKAYQMGADEVLALYSDQARGSVEDFLDKDEHIDLKLARRRGVMPLVKKLVETTRTKTVGTTVVIERKVTLELYSKQAALRDLGRHYKLFTDRIEHADWRTEAIDLIRRGELPFDVLAKETDSDLATELFESAGVPVAR